MRKTAFLLLQWGPLLAIAAGIVLLFLFAPHAGRWTQ
jgi:hypothetical protein